MSFGEKSEIKYVAISVAFAIFWFQFLLPKIIPLFDGNNPILTFFLFNIGLLVLLLFVFKAWALGGKIDFSKIFGLLLVFLALDCWMPPYMVSTSGQLIGGSVLYSSATDYIFGYIGQGLGLQGLAVYIFAYIILPFVLLLIASKLIKNFVRRIG